MLFLTQLGPDPNLAWLFFYTTGVYDFTQRLQKIGVYK